MFGRLTLPSHGPVFLNEGATRSELELRKMEALRSVEPDGKREVLERDIRLAQAGVAGEAQDRVRADERPLPLGVRP